MGNKVIIVRPSDLKKVGYCPTMYFFEVYIKRKPPLVLRAKALWGRLMHALHHAIRFGWVKEELMKASIDEMGIIIVGKPDSYKIVSDGELVLVEEFKSRKAPRTSGAVVYYGAWFSDALQLMAYAYILGRKYGRKVELRLRYLDKSITIPYDEETLLRYLSIIKDIVDGVFPDPVWVSRNKCRRCPYKEFCPFSPFSSLAIT